MVKLGLVEILEYLPENVFPNFASFGNAIAQTLRDNSDVMPKAFSSAEIALMAYDDGLAQVGGDGFIYVLAEPGSCFEWVMTDPDSSWHTTCIKPKGHPSPHEDEAGNTLRKLKAHLDKEGLRGHNKLMTEECEIILSGQGDCPYVYIGEKGVQLLSDAYLDLRELMPDGGAETKRRAFRLKSFSQEPIHDIASMEGDNEPLDIAWTLVLRWLKP